MKKIYLLLFFLTFTFSALRAQVTFNPGFRAGLNFAKFTDTDSGIYNWFDTTDYYATSADMKFMTGFYVGFQGNIRFAKLYALQPEVNFSYQGSEAKVGSQTYHPRISYLSFQAVNKFYFNDFNMQIGPSIDLVIDHKNIDLNSNTDLGFLFGLGYDISKNIGVEARVKKGIVPVANTGSEDHTNVLLQAGIYFTIPTK